MGRNGAQSTSPAQSITPPTFQIDPLHYTAAALDFDLDGIKPVPGLTIKAALLALEAKMREEAATKMDEFGRSLSEVKTEVASAKATALATDSKVDKMSGDLSSLALEMREGFRRNDAANSEAKVSRAQLSGRVAAIEKGQKNTHTKQDRLAATIDKCTDPKRIAALAATIGVAWGSISTTAKNLTHAAVPWILRHPVAEAYLQVFGFMLAAYLFYLFIRPHQKPAPEEAQMASVKLDVVAPVEGVGHGSEKRSSSDE